ncbi:MAG: hypothetical protein IIX18_01660 [Clostridia bacterium]|nr:hypothetical protein [Clostridia bacterium]MBQ6614004.1 hypothetical protein [Clostridia bacterium]
MKYYSKKILLCIMLILALAITSSAATLHEMKENGEVTDGGIPHGDVRDGIVSDVSDKNEGIIPDITDMIDGTHNSGTNDGGSHGTNMTDDPVFPSTGSTSRLPETSKAPATTNATSGVDASGNAGGMSRGLIITILVIVAVVVVILILLPKRR